MIGRTSKILSLLPIFIGIGLTIVFMLGVRNAGVSLSLAAANASDTRYVAAGGSDTGNDCTSSSSPCATIQHAVDQANPADEVRVAEGTYSDVFEITHTNTYTYTQVVFIDKALTLRGGYTTSNWENSSATLNPTILNPGGAGRGVTIIDTINDLVTVQSFTITGGDYTGLGNPPGASNMKCRSTDSCGGGLFVNNSTVNLSNLTITGNTAGSVDSEGGGMYLWSARTTTIDSVDVSNNTAHGGGGIAVTNQDWPMTIRNSKFNNNTASHSGGGMYFRSNIENLVTIEGCQINDNKATDGDGGGIRARLSTNGLVLQMDKVYVQNNQAEDAGFGLYLDAAGIVTPTARLNNIILSGNKRIEGSTETPEDAVITISPIYPSMYVELVHITAADNPVENFLYAEPRDQAGKFVTVTLTNTLLSGFDYGFAALEYTDTDVTIQHQSTLYFNLGNLHNPLGGSPTFTAVDQYWGNPHLKVDYHLGPNSTAIDGGYAPSLSVDIDGNTRPYGIWNDVGADEWVQLFVYLPLIGKD
ncbi:MAG: hypothetical protein U9R58_06710 [Chloroflexota bacterium]|nr:hypothetical protein [Chloroflexota bacterium]